MKRRHLLLLFVTAALAVGAVATAFAAEAGAKKVVDVEGTLFVPLVARTVSEERTLIFSDSPEYVTERTGILSAGTVDGEGRVYFYHVNESDETRKMAVVVENRSAEDNVITISRELYAKPSPEYFSVGRALSHKELLTEAVTADVKKPKGEKARTETIPPGGRKLLTTATEGIAVKRDELVSGLIDFSTTGETFVRVMMIPEEARAVGSSYTSGVLPIDDVRLRGTYEGAVRIVRTEGTYNPEIGAAYVELANGREDAFVEGVDEPSGETVRNVGNYGISYRIRIETTGMGAYDLFFNPLGGAYAGAIRVTNGRRSEIVSVPGQERPHIGHGTTEDSHYIGKYEAGAPLDIRFMPAGASNLPVRLLLVPARATEERTSLSEGAIAIRNRLLGKS